MRWKKLRNIVTVITLAIVCTFFGITEVMGPSMEPTYADGEIIIYMRFITPKLNDVVIATQDKGRRDIKRIVGLPNGYVEIQDGLLYYNGVVSSGDFDTSIDDTYYKTLTSDQYFLAGDNREVSMDSRYYGAVTKDEIIGRVIYSFKF